MPAPYGVTPTGFTTPTEADLLGEIEADQRAEISQGLDHSDESTLGLFNRIITRRLGVAWEAVEGSYHARDPDRAESDALTSLAKVTGTDRRGASRSLVPVTVTLAAETKLIAGQHFAHVSERPDSRWTPVDDFTAAVDGSFTLTFQAEHAGPIDTPVDSIAVIATPVVGWSAITASGEVVVGRNIDSDSDLRARREQALARAGSSTTAAIRADVLAIEQATTCTVLENYTEVTDSNGVPGHSFEAIVNAPGASDDAIAQVIWATRAGGIRSYGTSSGTAFDKSGEPHTMQFTRTQQVPVWMTYELVRSDGYVGDEAFATTVAERLDALLAPGAELTRYDAIDAAHALGVKVRAVRFGLAPSPASSADLTPTVREILRFDAGRIVLT